MYSFKQCLIETDGMNWKRVKSQSSELKKSYQFKFPQTMNLLSHSVPGFISSYYIYHSLADILVCRKTIHYCSTILLLSLFYRIAVNNLNFVSNILGIKNLVHKQKLANKATDVVLFGPPKCELITSIIIMHIFHHHMTCKP